MVPIDRKRLRDAFNRNVLAYNIHAEVQKRVIARLTQRLRELDISPGNMLDIGAGTGTLLKNLAGLYPEARLVGLDMAFGMCLAARASQPGNLSLSILSGDAEALPFRDHVFDLIVSTSTFQWLGDLDRVFAESFRALAPEGHFVFAMFGEKTLFELRGSYRQAWEKSGRSNEGRTHTFPSLCGVETELVRAGFGEVRVAAEQEIEFHQDVPALLRSLRSIGAGNAAPVRIRGLGERRVMTDMFDTYLRNHGADGLIPATYEVIYGIASKPLEARST